MAVQTRNARCTGLRARLKPRTRQIGTKGGRSFLKEGHQDWQPLILDNGQPFMLTRELFTVVMAEQSFRLQWLVNNLMLELEESGRLAAMRLHWFDEDYAYARRAISEGLPASAEESIRSNDFGGCRWARGS